MIAEQEQQTDARISHEHALALAAQAVIDAAVSIDDWEEHGWAALVRLGRMEDLQNAIDAWRELGGQTTDEMASIGMEDHYFSKGTTLP